MCDKTKTTDTTRELSKKIHKKCLDVARLTGIKYKSLRGGAVYVAAIISKDKVTQTDIAKACSVSEITIRNTYQKIIEYGDVQ